MSRAVISMIFLAPVFLSFSVVANSFTAWCFSLANSSARSSELPLCPTHAALGYCSLP